MKKTIKKKLKNLTYEEYKKWSKRNCAITEKCKACIFNDVNCTANKHCWVNHKDLYSEKFLEQEIEIEVEKPKLTEDEKVILRNLDKEWKYIARDESGDIWVFNGIYYSEFQYRHLFQFITGEDVDKTYLIEELLKDNNSN